MYIKHAAWLNAIPERAEGDRSKKPQLSRREFLAKQGVSEPDMPECDAMHIIEYLFELGPIMSGAMSGAALTHSEIAAWQSNTGVRLQSWEARFLRQLSMDYLIESQLAAKLARPAPWNEKANRGIRAGITAINMMEALEELARL